MIDVNHICYGCVARNIWGNFCQECRDSVKRADYTSVRGTFVHWEWCKSICQRYNECLYWKEKGQGWIAQNETSAKDDKGC